MRVILIVMLKFMTVEVLFDKVSLLFKASVIVLLVGHC